MKIFSQLLSRIGHAQKHHVALSTLGLCALALIVSSGVLLHSAKPVEAGGKGGGSPVTIVNPHFFDTVSGVVDITIADTNPADSMDVDITQNPPADFSAPLSATLQGDGNWHVSWNTLDPAYTNATYFITARATSGGVPTTSDPVRVDVQNVLETITNPNFFDTVSGNVVLTANMNSAAAAPSSVSFVVDGDSDHPLVASDAGGNNWTATLNTSGMTEDVHYVAVVVDRSGSIDTSNQTPFLVQNITINLDDPTAGATVSGNVPLSATASSNVSAVEFHIFNGGPMVVIPATKVGGSWTASWDASTQNDGNTGIAVQATSASDGGQSRTTDQTFVTVDNFEETLVSPTPSSNTTVYGTLNLAATITGTVTTADSLSFQLEGHDANFNTFFSRTISATFDGTKWVASLDTTQVPEGIQLFVSAVASYGSLTDSSASGGPLGDTLLVQNYIVSMTGPVDNATATSTFTLRATVKDHANAEVVPSSLSFLLVSGETIGGQFSPPTPVAASYNSSAHEWFLTLNTLDESAAHGNQDSTYGYTATAVINGNPTLSSAQRAVVISIPSLTVALTSPTPCVNPPNQVGCHTFVSGVVPLSATVAEGADSVTFTVTKSIFGFQTVIATLPGTLANGHWIASWDSTSQPNTFGYALMVVAQKAGYRISGPGCDASCVSLPGLVTNNGVGVTGSLVFPLDQTVVTGTVALVGQTDQFPDSVSFFITNLRGDSTFGPIPATYDSNTDTWVASWDTSLVNFNGYNAVYYITMNASKVGFTPLQTPSIQVGLVSDFSTFDNSGGFAVLKQQACANKLDCANAPVSITSASTFEFVSPLDGGTVSSTYPFKVHIVPGVAKATMQLYSVSGKETDIPLTKDGSGEYWTSKFDTSTLANGTYYMSANAVFADSTPAHIAHPISFTVHNGHATANATFNVALASPTSTGAILVNGSLLEATTTQPVQSLSFELTGVLSSTDIRALAKDGTNMDWFVLWNSSGTVDGSYLLDAFATTGTAVSQSSDLKVTVRNATSTTRTTATSTEPYNPKDDMALATSIDVAMGYQNAKASKPPCLPGNRYKAATSTSIYYCGIDDQLHPFPNAKVYFSWYQDFKGILPLDPKVLAAVIHIYPVDYRPASTLFKSMKDPKVYTVQFRTESVSNPKGLQAGGPIPIRAFILRWMKTENVAKALFGEDWAKKVVDVAENFFDRFNAGTILPNGLGLARYGLGGDIDQSTVDSMASSTSSTTSTTQ